MFLSGLKCLRRLERQVKFANPPPPPPKKKKRCSKIKPVDVHCLSLHNVLVCNPVQFFETIAYCNGIHVNTISKRCLSCSSFLIVIDILSKEATLLTFVLFLFSMGVKT